MAFLIASIILVVLYYANLIKAPETELPPQGTLISTLLTVSVIHFNKAGRIDQQLQSPLIKHHGKASKNIIMSPVIALTKKGKPWKITANKATLLNHNKKIILEGNVVISQYEKGKKVSQLTTHKLFYYPDQQRINTPENITYLNQGLTIHSKGLKADLNKETLELTSKARGTYAKNNH